MKKFLMFLIVCLFVTTALTGCFGKKKETPKGNNGTTNPPIEEQVDDKTKVKQGDLEFKNIKITAFGAMNTVSATVTNTGSKTLSFKAVLYMKNNDKKTLGKVDQVIEGLGSKASKEISIQIMGDYTTVTTYEVVVEPLNQ
ncbi:MAG: hypothetical protein ACM3O4_06425 [Ignavibacteriales bacterium]